MVSFVAGANSGNQFDAECQCDSRLSLAFSLRRVAPVTVSNSVLPVVPMKDKIRYLSYCGSRTDLWLNRRNSYSQHGRGVAYFTGCGYLYFPGYNGATILMLSGLLSSTQLSLGILSAICRSTSESVGINTSVDPTYTCCVFRFLNWKRQGGGEWLRLRFHRTIGRT
jgi:hypothetical protein